MEIISVQSDMAGQRLDKYLKRYLKAAGSGFIYKMLRKKNITLNGKKADGSELISAGDEIAFYMAAETLTKFRGMEDGSTPGEEVYAYIKECNAAYKNLPGITIVYEDENILVVNKPLGLTCQKSRKNEVSLNEWLCGYLLKTGKTDPESLSMYRPACAHRLDKNTRGLVICPKSYVASKIIAQAIKDRTIKKYYICAVESSGIKRESRVGDFVLINGFIKKDEKTNKVKVSMERIPGSSPIKTAYRLIDREGDEIHPNSLIALWNMYLKNGKDNHNNQKNIPVNDGTDPAIKELPKGIDYLEVELITGKSHQIRAHLAFEGMSLIGDTKYGNKNNGLSTNYQFLFSYKLGFPQMPPPLESLSGRTITLLNL